MNNGISNRLAAAVTACVLSLTATAAPAAWTAPNRESRTHFIVEADSTSAAARLVRRVEVKCKLIASAAPAVTSAGTLAYSVFQQGAGLINAVGAVNSTATNCANQGLNISADLAGTTHFGGPANQDASGNF